MKKYTIYFEIFGKKMKTTVSAKNEEDAKNCIKNKIVFHKVEKSKTDIVEHLAKMWGIKL